MSDDKTFLREAIALARAGAAAGVGGPFGAVVVHEGRVIGRGQNRVTSTCDPTAHAEVVALLYSSCEPCPMCLAAAYWAHVARIVFAGTRTDAAAAGFDDEFLYRELTLPPEARRLPLVPLLRAEGVVAFDEWRHQPGRIPY